MPHQIEKGQKLREGITVPHKVCDNCGETKSVQYFPKRGGIYKKYKQLDPRRYDNQCKKCRRAVRPGQKREELPEIRLLARVQAGNRGAKTRKLNEQLERAKETRRDYKKRIRQETRIQSMVYLAEKGCEECGERDPRKLEYDHRDPGEKRGIISKFIIDGYSWTSPTIANEIAKCRVLCASCHRKHTIIQQGYYAADEIQIALGRLSARFKFDL